LFDATSTDVTATPDTSSTGEATTDTNK